MTRDRATRRTPSALLLTFLFACVASGGLGCNMIDAALGRDAHLSNLVPGQSVQGGDLQCWLTFEFDRVPDDIDARDVVVRFSSPALRHPVEFDWDYIASHDMIVPEGNASFGTAHRSNEASTPSKPPPVGAPFKVKFSLPAKERIENAPSTLWLRADLVWGGAEMDSTERTIEHVYASTRGGFL